MKEETGVSRENPWARSDQLKQNPYTMIVELGGIIVDQYASLNP